MSFAFLEVGYFCGRSKRGGSCFAQECMCAVHALFLPPPQKRTLNPCMSLFLPSVRHKGTEHSVHLTAISAFPSSPHPTECHVPLPPPVLHLRTFHHLKAGETLQNGRPLVQVPSANPILMAPTAVISRQKRRDIARLSS